MASRFKVFRADWDTAELPQSVLDVSNQITRTCGWAATRVCRAAGARVATHALVRLEPHHNNPDPQPVIAHGLPLRNGAQVTVDTTLESPRASSGQPRPQGHQANSPAFRAACQAKERTYPELVRDRQLWKHP